MINAVRDFDAFWWKGKFYWKGSFSLVLIISFRPAIMIRCHYIGNTMILVSLGDHLTALPSRLQQLLHSSL